MESDFERAAIFESSAARLPYWCFAIASITAVVGVTLGMYMGIAEDHQLVPVHAHFNLLGWVSLFLMGLFYKSHEQALGWAATLQVAIFTAGYVIFLSGLAVLIRSDHTSMLPAVIIGSSMVWIGFVMFALIVLRELRR